MCQRWSQNQKYKFDPGVSLPRVYITLVCPTILKVEAFSCFGAIVDLYRFETEMLEVA